MPVLVQINTACAGGGGQEAWHAPTPLADADGPRICIAITVADADRPRTLSCGRGLSADAEFVDPHTCHRRYVPYVDFSYRGRFVPWIFRTIRGSFVPFVPRTIRTILGLFVPSLNSDVSMKLDDADDKPSTPRMDGCN